MTNKESQGNNRTGESRGHIADGSVSPPTTVQSSYLRNNQQLLEEILERENLLKALKRVERNGGSGGIDGITVQELRPYLKDNWPKLKASLLQGSYYPSPVKQQMIPKATGGERKLGIPTTLDRLIQQAILQVIQGEIDPTFSDNSYGFRPKRSPHQAVLKARQHCQEGREVVVDIDLEQFFDTVNHDMLMSELHKRIGDQRVLNLLRRYLNSGVMSDGLVRYQGSGTPQGGPLSPLLSNLVLDKLDKELEQRGLSFVRYADDVQIFVKSERAGSRVLQSISRFISSRLKLQVNQAKSQVGMGLKYLGFLVSKSSLEVCPKAIDKFKDKIREQTKIRGGRNLSTIISEISPVIRGWREYFKLAKNERLFERLDGWIRRRIRACQYVLYKNGERRIGEFIKAGLSYKAAYQCAYSSKGPWRMSRCEGIQKVLSNGKLKNIGLASLSTR